MSKPWNFAHLLGGNRRASTDDENTDTAEGDQPEDDAEAEDGEEANADEDDGSASTEDEDSTAEGEDDEDVSARAFARGRTAERKRCAAIFASPAAAANIAAACELAFNTRLSAAQATGVLGLIGKAGGKAGGGLASAMSRLGNPRVGNGGGGANSSAAHRNPLVAAHAKATGRRGPNR